jgi:predicted enzyme related to lactoylglutathione lyase
MNRVVHFEMPYDDPERMAKFYQSAFGWETRHLGESMGDYVLATTTESDQDGPREPGAINGGFFPKQPDRPMQVPSIVIAVERITEAVDRVTRAGGKVLGEPMDIPGVGKYVSFVDPEGNRVSMLEPARQEPSRRVSDTTSRGTHGSRVSAGSREEHSQEWSPRRSSQSSTESPAGKPRRKRD